MMNTAFGPIAQGLASSALNNGLGDSLVRIGMNRDRLVRAAEMTVASENLSPREVGALAYAQGLSGDDTAFLAFGSGRAFAMKPSADRIARLGSAKPMWWADPVTRVGDLGSGATKQMLGATLGLDLGKMANSDPLPVPADTRFAAFAQLVLGDHWELGLGIKDQSWIDSLNESHKDIAVKFLVTKDARVAANFEEDPEDRDLYHQVHVPCVPVLNAPIMFGSGVGMVVAAGKQWLEIFVHTKRGQLEVSVNHLNQNWHISGRGQRFGIDGLRFTASSLAEVGFELMKKVPEATGWRVISLRFPSRFLAAAAVEDARRMA